MGELTLDITIFVGVLAAIGALIWLVDTIKKQRQFKKRIERFKNRKAAVPAKLAAAGDIATLRRGRGEGAMPMMDKVVKTLPTFAKMQERFDKASINVSVERYIIYCVLLFIAITIIAWLLIGKGWLLAIFLGIIIGAGIPHFYVNFRIARQMKKFIILFPDAIDLIVRGLRSGLPVAESIQVVAKEIEDPIGRIFQRVADAIKLGVPMEQALADTAKKLELTEFNFFTTSIVLQRETGGNLSEILNNLSTVLRSRTMMRLKIKAMSSEARASAYIIGALPFLVIGAVYIFSPEYLKPLFNDYRGNLWGLGAMCSLIMGVTVMTKMTRFEI